MKFFRILLVLFLLAAVAGGYVLYLLNRPFKHFEESAFVDFPKGTSTEDMASLLEGEGVIEHSWMFLLARALSPGTKLQAGEYQFTKPASTFAVLKRIARGDIFYYELLVPEGNNIFDIADSVEKLGIFKGEAFMKVARNPKMIRDLDSTAPTLEGYLFPNTYRLSRHTTAEQLCRLMTNKFRETWKELNTTADAHTTVTLASLVEKEARLPQERPLIASAFRNRLKIGMKLDCDPTTVYAALLEGRYRGKIYKSDLESTNPYNTYRKAGLPPGPIANPSRSSLKAVLEPADTSHLYFVAKGDGSGGHTFSDTLSAHNAATAQFRNAEKQ
ncbi:MAG: endolytic transglycosylase MltG [Acidobacteriota bacterium]|nr:endolytic transglycosylase MltG [Acidobacteriota bacterium]